MTRPARLILLVLAALVVVWGLTSLSKRVYFQPLTALSAEIETISTRVDRYRQGVDDAVRIHDGLRAYVDRTLGGDLESVDHRLRTRLNRIAERIGLAEAVVGTGRAARRQTPARRRFSRREKELRDEIDFVELSGWITAQGSLPQVLQLADAIDAEPWLKRIDQLRFDHKADGERFAVTVRLTTLFLPGREPAPVEYQPYDPARLQRFSAFLNANPFAVPAPAPPPTAVVAPVDPLQLWSVTGIAQTSRGAEVWIFNTTTKQSRTLRVGEAFESITLVSVDGERAIFSEGDRSFVLVVGRKLGDRSREPR